MNLNRITMVGVVLMGLALPLMIFAEFGRSAGLLFLVTEVTALVMTVGYPAVEKIMERRRDGQHDAGEER